jgi:hypothetical protein
VIDITCLLTFLVGLAIGIVWQEIHFSDVSRALLDAKARMDALERRLAGGEGE